MSRDSVIARAPASTSNCGPGFDSLSIALSLYNFVSVQLRDDGLICGPSGALKSSETMAQEVARGFEQASGVAVGGFDYDVWGEVPIARGLGSSSTVRGGIVAGLNSLMGSPLSEEEMIRLTTRLDSAPDNACAVFSGGFCIARTDPETFAYLEHIHFDLPEALTFIAVSPDYEVLTDNARQVLPDTLPFADAIRSTNSLAYLVGVLVSGDFARLNGAVSDFIHQPYRAPLNPFGQESIEAGCAAGAYTGWLSGSGSTVVCIADAAKANVVAGSMQSVYGDNGHRCRAYRLKVDNAGLTVDEGRRQDQSNGFSA